MTDLNLSEAEKRYLIDGVKVSLIGCKLDSYYF